MTKRHSTILGMLVALFMTAGIAGAADSLWLHVKVSEDGGAGAKVTVNLPIALVETAMTMIPEEAIRDAHMAMDDVDVTLEDLRKMWTEVRDSPDMTFVTVEEEDESVRVWKENDYLYVTVRGRDDEQVDVKIPGGVVDAFLSGDEFDLSAAIQALVAHGEGEFVTVRDGDDHVRVWVDAIAEAE